MNSLSGNLSNTILALSKLHKINQRSFVMAECGCGRSPNGNCVGWHNLTEEQYLEKKAAYEEKQSAK